MENPAPACPRDGRPLIPLTAHPGGAACADCGGLYLRDEAKKSALESNGMDLAKTRTLFALPAPLPCPGCALPMKGLAFDGIEVDLCEGCKAIWLDKGEIEKVDASLKAGPATSHPASPASVDDFGIFAAVVEFLLRRF